MFAWSERHRETALAQAFRRPGLRDAAPVRDAGADRGAARGGPRGADRDPPPGSAGAVGPKFSRAIPASPVTSGFRVAPPVTLAAALPRCTMDWSKDASASCQACPSWTRCETWALTWMPILLMGALVYLIWRSLKMMPRTKPQQIKPEGSGAIGWDDVAGCDEAKHELREVVEFLRDPDRFKKLGASVPKGILLHGPPGTGKTLLAKAVAKESGAHFFSQSASSFVEMFAGLGAARIRRLFPIAKKHAPGDHLHRRDRRGRPEARLRPLAREGPDAQPAAGRDGRLRGPRRPDRDRGLEPHRRPRPGAAAPGPLRPPGAGLAARPRGSRADPEGAHPQEAGRRRRPRHGRAPHRRADGRRPRQPLQRGRDLRRPRGPRHDRCRSTSTARSSASSPACRRAA